MKPNKAESNAAFLPLFKSKFVNIINYKYNNMEWTAALKIALISTNKNPINFSLVSYYSVIPKYTLPTK